MIQHFKFFFEYLFRNAFQSLISPLKKAIDLNEYISKV